MQSLERYMARWGNLHLVEDRRRWRADTHFRPPHKPLLLLALLDLFGQGRIEHNLIEPTADLYTLFRNYAALVTQVGEEPLHLAVAFDGLRQDRFWHLEPMPGRESELAAREAITTDPELQELVVGAVLDEALFELCGIPEARERLRSVLIERYFAPVVWAQLHDQAQMHQETFAYGDALVRAARKTPDMYAPSTVPVATAAVRGEGFRYAVLAAYAHRCAFCGVRITTAAGQSAVDAVQIVPWGVLRIDDVRNGLALCRLCQWAFEAGLLGVNEDYTMLTAPELRAAHNLPAHLGALSGQPMLRPADRALWPDRRALAWHRQERMGRR